MSGATSQITKPLRVIVVDDTRHVREMLATMLELDGFDVVGAAGGGGEAVELVRVLRPDVVIMDYKMPEVDGLTATRRIREHLPDMPVILYTAYLDPVLESAANEAGVTVCVGKIEGLATLESHITAVCRTLAAGT